MTESITISIRIPVQLHQALKRRAAEENKSMAQVLREAAMQYLAASQTSSHEWMEMENDDPLWLIGTDPVDLGITDASVNHDVYLYGPLSDSAKAEIAGK